MHAADHIFRETIDGCHDPPKNRGAGEVAFRHQFIGAHGGKDRCVLAVELDVVIGARPDLPFLHHRDARSAGVIAPIAFPFQRVSAAHHGAREIASAR